MGVEQIYYDAFHNAKEYQARIDQYNSLKRSIRKTNFLLKEICSWKLFQKSFRIKKIYYLPLLHQSEINMLMHMADSMGFKINTFTHILEGYKVADKMKLHGAGASTFSDWWSINMK